MTLGELPGHKPDTRQSSNTAPRRMDSYVYSGPGLSPAEYTKALAARTAPVLAQVYQEEGTDESIREQINEIVSGAKGSIEVSFGVIKALHGAGLASNSVLTATQIGDDGPQDIRYQKDDEQGAYELLRVAAYVLHLPTGEGVEKGRHNNLITIKAERDNDGYDFNHWTLSRSEQVNH